MALHLSTLAIRLKERLVNVQQGIAEMKQLMVRDVPPIRP